MPAPTVADSAVVAMKAVAKRVTTKAEKKPPSASTPTCPSPLPFEADNSAEVHHQEGHDPHGAADCGKRTDAQPSSSKRIVSVL